MTTPKVMLVNDQRTCAARMIASCSNLIAMRPANEVVELKSFG